MLLEVVLLEDNGWEADGPERWRLPRDRVYTVVWEVHR